MLEDSVWVGKTHFRITVSALYGNKALFSRF